jgi:hypothetical protein
VAIHQQAERAGISGPRVGNQRCLAVISH